MTPHRWSRLLKAEPPVAPGCLYILARSLSPQPSPIRRVNAFRAALAASALTVLGVLIAPSLALGATGSISGTVTDASTHAPIEGILVCAYSEDFEFEEFEESCAATGADGKYTVAGLAPGEYQVEFWPKELNYLRQFYNGKSSFGEADTVNVATGAITGIDAAMVEGGKIEGTVIDSSSKAGIEGVLACAFGEGGGNFVEKCAVTDASGAYTIAGLPTGASYKVEFWPGFEGLDYLFQYYDGAASFEDADPVSVTTGATTPGIDAELERGGQITGTVTDASTHAPLQGVEVCAFGLTEEFGGCGFTNAAGSYAIAPLATDSYEVVFFAEFGPGGSYLTQYYNGKSNSVEADPVLVTAPQTKAGIDAHLVRKPSPHPPVVLPHVVVPIPPAPVPVKTVKCRKGFKRKMVRGKFHCVKVNHKRQHRRAQHGARGSGSRLFVPAR